MDQARCWLVKIELKASGFQIRSQIEAALSEALFIEMLFIETLFIEALFIAVLLVEAALIAALAKSCI